MKVDLLDDLDSNGWHTSAHPRPISLKRSLPFYTRGPSYYVHRVRSGLLHHDGRISVTFWCGPIGHGKGGARLAAEPPEGCQVCSTCEGRAVGSGQLGSRVLAGGREVIFSPAPGRKIECVWERGSRGYAWIDYHQCRTRARFVASKDGGEDRPTCLYHTRSMKAINAGWVFAPMPAPFESGA
ncbi:MAG TPA: hypothetical protein VMW08_00935 [Acidimicrobiales bacterium]|nr:hypothetical protein [Acidimicrobiales bacterium]